MYFYWSLRFLSDADLTLEFNIYLRGAQAHRFEVTHPPRPLIVGFVEGDSCAGVNYQLSLGN